MAAALVLAGTLASAAETIGIAHGPAACVSPERYARVVATGTPPDAVASAEVVFRGDGGDWYGVRMTRGTGGWSAFLPRAQRGTAKVEYRIVMTDAGARPSASAAYALPVEEGCAGEDAAVQVSAPIVVRVPAGAPPVPPVPPGFNPAGVVAAEGPPSRDSWRLAKWIGGAAAAAAVGAIAAGVTEREDDVPPTPDFAITGTRPLPRGPVSVREGILVFVDVTGEPAGALTFTWQFSLRAGLQECLSMSGGAAIGAERPVRLELSAPLRASGSCGSSFNTDNVRLAILVGGETAREVVREMRFQVVP